MRGVDLATMVDAYGTSHLAGPTPPATDSGVFTLPQAQTAIVPLNIVAANANYSPILGPVENVVDANPSLPIVASVIAKTTTNFTVWLSATPDSNNYKLPWRI